MNISTKFFSLLTASVSALLLSASASQASPSRVVSYYTLDTTDPVTEYQLQSYCNDQTNQAQAALAPISTRLTGTADGLGVVGYYGQTPSNTGPVNTTNPQMESYCYLTFTSNDAKVLFDAYSAVQFSHLSSTTWDTACKPVYDQLAANPNTVIDDYNKTATLFQGKICEVTTVQAVPQTSTSL